MIRTESEPGSYSTGDHKSAVFAPAKLCASGREGTITAERLVNSEKSLVAGRNFGRSFVVVEEAFSKVSGRFASSVALHGVLART